jgi:hypothetical protein
MGRKHSHPTQAGTQAEADDFTLVKGIGPTIAARLHKAGILTFIQLAELSSTDIAARHGGLSAKRIVKERWTSQARYLARKRPSPHQRTSVSASESHQHYATFTVELLLDEDNSVRRTRVTYIQDEEEEAAWAGWTDVRLVGFFVRCAKLHVPVPEPSLLPKAVSPPATSPSAPTAMRPLCVKLNNGLSGVLRVSELVAVPLGSDVPQYNFSANEAFDVRLVLDLTEVKKSPSVSFEYTVTIWAKKLGIGARQIVGEARGTVTLADQVPCTVKAIINSQGAYRLEAIVTLAQQSQDSLPLPGLMAIQRGSPLQVF